MKQFLLTDENIVLCDTPQSRIELQRLTPGIIVNAPATPPVEVVLCVVEGDLVVQTAGESLHLSVSDGVQLPAGHGWQATVGATGAKVLRVDSFHPGFTPEKSLMPPLAQFHRFTMAGGQKLVYTFTGPAGTIVYTAPDEWHIIETMGDEPLLMFLTVTPNIVPSHTFFDANGEPLVRSWEPLRRMG